MNLKNKEKILSSKKNPFILVQKNLILKDQRESEK